MKIAVLKKDYDPEGGGAERYAANICRGLASKGHIVTVFSETFTEEDGLRGKIFHHKVPSSLLSGFSATSAFHRNIRSILKPRDFDLVYALSRTFPSDVYRVTESLHICWMKIRYLAWQKINPRHAEILKLEKRIFNPKNTKCVIANSFMIKKQIQDIYSFPPDRITVIRNGVDHKLFFPPENCGEKLRIRRALNIGEEKLVLLFAAKNFKIKGLDDAIRSIAMLDAKTKKDILLLVVGGDDSSRGLNLAAKLAVSENIRFDGKKKNLRDYYAASDLLFYPSLYEPFANVCLEAFACGLPVLTTAVNGASEIVEHGKNGYVVSRAGEMEKMASCIADFAGFDEKKRAKFAESAHRVSLSFDWEKHLTEIEKLFADIAVRSSDRETE